MFLKRDEKQNDHPPSAIFFKSPVKGVTVVGAAKLERGFSFFIQYYLFFIYLSVRRHGKCNFFAPVVALFYFRYYLPISWYLCYENSLFLKKDLR